VHPEKPTKKHRLAVARFWFEGNSFSPRPTTMACFAQREWTCGSAALDAARGTATELAAVAAFAEEHPDWDVTVLRCCSANPGGPIEAPVFAAIVAEIVEGLRGQKWDAVYLSLHGGAVVSGEDTPERALIAAVREAVGAGVPIAASFDLHGNEPPVDLLSFASAYRSYPHVDMRETAERVLLGLMQIVRGQITLVGVIEPLKMPLPSFNMRTAGGPMAEAEALARAHERGAVLDVSVFGGFPYADTLKTGASVTAFAGNITAATHAARSVADGLRQRVAQFAPQLLAPDEGLRRALASPPGLVAVTDPADNPYSGGAADTPGLFRALLALARTGALRGVPTVFAYFADPDVVAAARAAGADAMLDVTLGGKTSAAFGAGVPVRARVLRLTQARFVNSGPMETGLSVDLGDSAVLAVEGIQIIVTTRSGPANDPAFFAAQGIDLDATRLLCVKAKNHFRAAFEPRCAAIIDVDCPGPAMADLAGLPFRHRRDDK
jgi:microcystin degradation protein MlrC